MCLDRHLVWLSVDSLPVSTVSQSPEHWSLSFLFPWWKPKEERQRLVNECIESSGRSLGPHTVQTHLLSGSSQSTMVRDSSSKQRRKVPHTRTFRGAPVIMEARTHSRIGVPGGRLGGWGSHSSPVFGKAALTR